MSKDAIIEAGISKKEPYKIKSDVTQEMIDEHNKNLNKPIQIGDKLYKYVPSSINIDEKQLDEIEADKMSLMQESIKKDEIDKSLLDK